MKVFAVNHGQTFLDAVGRIQGCKSNPSLTVKGRDQAHKIAKTLSSCGIDVIISSPLKRSLKTAEIIAEHLHIGKGDISVSTKLNERDFGDYEHKPLTKVDMNSLRRWTDNAPTPNGETIREVTNRIVVFMDITLELFNGKTILLVVHDHVLRALHWYFHGIPKPGGETPIETGNGTLFEFDTTKLYMGTNDYDFTEPDTPTSASKEEAVIPDTIIIPEAILNNADSKTSRVLGQNEIDDLIKNIFEASRG
jgi:probable phosphoglycerate mutase